MTSLIKGLFTAKTTSTSSSDSKESDDMEKGQSSHSAANDYYGVHFNVGPNGKLPSKGTSGAAGYDVYSAQDITISPGSRALVSTDLKMSFSPGIYCQLKSRSGNAAKGIDVGAGVIDSDYRGEVKVLLINSSTKDFIVKTGDRVAQMLFIPLATVAISEVKVLDSTQRNEGGFGSTGV